jgi:hypothetical protein
MVALKKDFDALDGFGIRPLTLILSALVLVRPSDAGESDQKADAGLAALLKL